MHRDVHWRIGKASAGLASRQTSQTERSTWKFTALAWCSVGVTEGVRRKVGVAWAVLGGGFLIVGVSVSVSEKGPEDMEVEEEGGVGRGLLEMPDCSVGRGVV